jgi:hypothetical protein
VISLTSFHLFILLVVVRPLKGGTDNTAVLILIELERHLDIDAIKFGLRQRSQLTLTKGADSHQVVFLGHNLRHLILEAVLTDMAFMVR